MVSLHSSVGNAEIPAGAGRAAGRAIARALRRSRFVLLGAVAVSAIAGAVWLADGVASQAAVAALREQAADQAAALAAQAAGIVPPSDGLAGWRQQRARVLLVGDLAALATVWLLCLFARQARRLDEQTLGHEQARERLDLALRATSEGICFFDSARRLLVCNRSYGEIYGLPGPAMQPGAALEQIVDAYYPSCAATGLSREDYLLSQGAVAWNGSAYQSVVQMGDGRTVAVRQQPTPDGGWMAVHADITERCRADERLTFLAWHDGLTGLANRAALEARLAQVLPRLNHGRLNDARLNRGGGFALLCLDLDHFREVNESLGHAAGDEVLRLVGARLLACVREGDAVARLGGDAFAILQMNVQAPLDAALLAERVIASVSAPITLGGEDIAVGVSIGIEPACDGAPSQTKPSQTKASQTKPSPTTPGPTEPAPAGPSPADLLKSAELALHLAKREGGGTFRFFAPELDAAIHNRRALERDLRGAMARGELAIRYRPIIETHSRALAAFDAVLQWDPPEAGAGGAEDFSTVAEETGLIVPIARWMIEQACRVAATWPDDVHVIVSLSPRQFRTVDLAETVRAILAETGLDPGRLELQIGGAVLQDCRDQRLATLHRLRDFGAGVVLGGFGGPQSSLDCLRNFPFDRVRIDRSLVGSLAEGDAAIPYLRAAVGLCRDLGIPTTADGVATEAQLAIVAAQGCTHAQGDLTSRPRPSPRLAWLNDRARPMSVASAPHAEGQRREALAEP